MSGLSEVPDDFNPETMPDMQNGVDNRGVALHRVGIEDVKFPIQVQRKDGAIVAAQATVAMYCNLSSEKKGINMSRAVESLMVYHDEEFTPKVLNSMLSLLKKKMQSEDAYIKIDFVYFLEKAAPVTKKIAVEGYPVTIVGFLDKDNNFHRSIRLHVFVQSLCACSKEISKYGAHNQRCQIRVDLYPTRSDALEWFEDIIPLIEEQGSVPLYPLLKRPDEKFVTEKAYENPKFVEDIARDVGLVFKKWVLNHTLTGFEIKVKSYESIHNHQAVAYFKEGYSMFEV